MIKLHFEKLSRLPRIGEPCTVAIPFSQGELIDISKVAIKDGEAIVPTQCRVTAKWEDNSVKWLLVNFLADLPGNKSKDFYCVIGEDKKEVFEEKVSVKDNEGRLSLDTGSLNIELNLAEEKGLFNKISCNKSFYNREEIVGPMITDSNGEKWRAIVGSQGWEIIEEGPVRAIIQTKGKHFNDEGKSFIDYVVRLYAYAGKPWIKLDYQIINKEKSSEQKLNAIEINFKNNNSSELVNTALGTSNYWTEIVQGNNGEKLYHIIDANQLIYEANEHIPETFYGTFFADWRERERGGICATIYQAHQNFPKAMEVDSSGLKIQILPSESEGLTLLQGMAKTHKVYLHFHDYEEEIQNLNIRSLQFQLPDRPVLEAEVYERSGVFENVFVKNKIDIVENALIYKADGRGKAYGILHWGDAPDPGYTQQGRGNGEPVWTNNEYDFPHAAMLMYARTGERRMLDYLLVSAEHWFDVDVCHYSEDPLRYKAQIIHSAKHVTGDVEASHEWVEGLLDYYHVTGEKVAYEAAIDIGENVLRQMKQPRYQQKGGINARETGWALRTLVALYKETYDEKWLQPADWIVSHFEAWKEEYGEWLAPYTDHTAIRVPFMIAVAIGSLMRYYRVKPEERIKTMIIDAAKDLVENCKLENGLFFYKELPSLRRLGNNTIVLEALTYAYELTGDDKYLKEGIDTFKSNILGSGGHVGGGKRIAGDALIMNGPGPKGFAQSFYPLTCYYKAVTDLGIFKENL